MTFVPLPFNAAASNLVFNPNGMPGWVTSTVGNNAAASAVYTQTLSAVRIDYQAPQTPSIVALVLSLYTTETGFIDLNLLGPPVQNSSGVFPGPYSAVYSGITVTFTETNGGVWGETAFSSVNPDGSLRLFTGFPVIEITFSSPVTNFSLRGWGAWSGSTDALILSGEVVPAEQVNGDPIPCDCCPCGTPLCGPDGLVISCRRANGAIEWYDSMGALVSTDPTEQIIFQPANVVGLDGWFGVGNGLFDVGNDYTSGTGGSLAPWTMRKILTATVGGLGNLIIPAGTFPSGGGVYADDLVLLVRLNGVAVPFTGSGGPQLTVQTRPVTWLCGPNVIDIVVGNTVPGNTSIAGRMDASFPTIGDCCT